jgi:AraC-like DNA-binding protein
MQADKGDTVNKDQEIIALEIEKQLREKHESGGGCIYLSVSEWAERLEVSEGEFLRLVAELVDAGKVKPSVIEICG